MNKLRGTGFQIQTGDMLKWFPMPEGFRIGAFDMTGSGAPRGPIALEVLPRKVQKRANEALRKLTP